MQKPLFAVGIMAACYAMSSSASAQSCAQGQIYRVSLGVCQAKSSENAHWLKQGSMKPALKQSAAKPEVGDIVLFGATLPTLLKPTLAKPAAKAPPRKAAVAKTRAARPTVAKAIAPKKSPPAVAALPAARPNLEPVREVEKEQANVPRPKPAEVPAPVIPPTEVAKSPAPSATDASREAEPAPANVASAPANEPRSAPANEPRSALAVSHEDGARDEVPAVAQSDQKTAAVEAPSDLRPSDAPAQTNAAPPPSTEPAQSSTSTASVEASKQVRTIPLYHRPDPSPPAAAPSNLPDWGDEKKLVEALRADWKGAPVTRTFHRGEEVPADIPLQPLPPPFANRDTGVKMHYLMSNGDAVLVLPTMRVVVDVYHSSTASLR